MEEEVRSKLVSFLFKGGQWTHGTGTASATFSPFIFHLSFNSLEEICSAGEDFLGLKTHKAFQEIFEPDTPTLRLFKSKGMIRVSLLLEHSTFTLYDPRSSHPLLLPSLSSPG